MSARSRNQDDMKIDNRLNSAPSLPVKATYWIRQRYDPSQGAFRFSPRSPVCLLGSCCAALACEVLSSFPLWTSTQVEAWASFIQTFQRQDGWFEDPYLQPNAGNALDSDYLRGHATFLAVMALDALGRKPIYRLKFLDRWKDDDQLYEWIDRLEWTNPWRESNWVEWIGYWLLADGQLTSSDVPITRELYPRGFAGLLGWLDDHQDPVTGYWGNPPFEGPQRILCQMAGAYHHYVFYYATNKHIRYVERLVDHTLSLQQLDGLFAPHRVGGGPCEDLDAIDILANMHRLTDYRRDDIEKGLKRALIALLRNQRSNGAFVYAFHSDCSAWISKSFRTLFCPTYSPGLLKRLQTLRQYVEVAKHGSVDFYGGCQGISFRIKEGDMFSQWFRPLAIAIAASAIGRNRSPVWWPFGFRRQITQGWWPDVSDGRM